MAESMKIGDRVVLMSGGPLMTIECDMGAPRVFCTWRGESGIEGAEFNRRCLRDPNTEPPQTIIIDDDKKEPWQT